MTSLPARGAVLATAALAVVAVLTATTGCAGPSADRVASVMIALPASHTPSASAGGLVADFPTVVPIPPSARITASAVQDDGEALVGVSVTGTSRRSTEQLLGYFRARLGKAGFTATDGSLLPTGTSGAAFSRGERELILVAVADRGGERSWSVGGTIAR